MVDAELAMNGGPPDQNEVANVRNGTLLYDWDEEQDPRNPFNWSSWIKWRLTVSVLIVSILFGLPAGAYGAESFNGRMPGCFGVYIIFFIFLVPCGVAQNFETMVVCRFFGGGASSVAINIVGGTISDVWKGAQQRSLPMALFGTTSVIGIALGPFGGAITTHLSFHWIYWILSISIGAFLPVFWFLLVETRGDIILARNAKKWRKENADIEPRYAEAEIDQPSMMTRLNASFKRPVKMLCTEWVVFSQTFWVSFAWGLLFLFQSSVPQTFSGNYGFKTSLVQLALSFPRQGQKMGNRSLKQDSSVPGSLLFTTDLFWYGWANYPRVLWIVPTFGVDFGLGIYSIYLAVVNYLTDSYEKYAASAFSAASLGRNTFGAFLPLANPALYTNLGCQWASSLLGFIARRSPFMKKATFGKRKAREVGVDTESVGNAYRE
ncbi:related to multidrug resistant protein [Phialocephala subalpina]|uniref:Related to multidrug resistant protein n=1 Tax=Phialocephala subalpina TaxID=576137 RepID=A0A1L7WX02_9HELO|nr:related to multidrug resistant protein [Phialocephala subalpina]